MARNYIPVDRDQLFLVPPDMRDWLPEDHLAWFVIDVVERVDASALHERHLNEGPGRPAYDPEMLLALLIYAYASGVRSSRQIERLCETDVAYRVIAANRAPDHTTIARFRQDHAEASQRLFVDVLELCAKAGLASVGVVAVDGTKIAASASGAANRTRSQIEAQVEQIFAAAVRTDEEEDGRFGTSRGDEPPAQLRGRTARLSRLDAALAELEAQRAASRGAVREAKREKAAAQGRSLGGRKPKDPDARVADAEAALSAEKLWDDERRARRAEHEGVAARAGRRLRGRPPDDVHWRVQRAEQRLAEARERAALQPFARAREFRTNTTDPDSRVMKTRGGFIQGYNAQVAVNDKGVVLAATVTQDHNDSNQLVPMIKSVLANLSLAGVGETIGTMLFDAGYWSEANATAEGPDRLIATTRSFKLRRKMREEGARIGPPPEGSSLAEAMEHRLLSEDGAELYARRSSTVEPVFGQHKEVRDYRRFARRGLAAVQAEWELMNTAHNVNKLFRYGAST